MYYCFSLAILIILQSSTTEVEIRICTKQVQKQELKPRPLTHGKDKV